MHVSLGIPPDATDEHLRFAKQIGCNGVIPVLNHPGPIPGEERWEYEDLVRFKAWIEGFDLKLEALQHVRTEFWDKVRLGLPGRDDQMENYLQTIRNVGRAGIPILAHNFCLYPLYRTGTTIGRGGVTVTTYDHSRAPTALAHGREITADEMWANYEWFVKRAVPVAEEAGVRLALHPDDPNAGPVGGVAGIMSSLEGLERASRIVDSPAWGLLYCAGSIGQMGSTEAVLRGIRQFGPRGKIVYVHLRDVIGTADNFRECFLGEGPLDVVAVIRALKEIGYNGPIVDDHASAMIGDSGWNLRARGYQAGFLQGLLRAADALT